MRLLAKERGIPFRGNAGGFILQITSLELKCQTGEFIVPLQEKLKLLLELGNESW